jgi:hypothetical protein
MHNVYESVIGIIAIMGAISLLIYSIIISKENKKKKVKDNLDNNNKLMKMKFAKDKVYVFNDAKKSNVITVSFDFEKNLCAIEQVYADFVLPMKIFNYKKIIECNLVRDGVSVDSGGLSSAMVGEAIAGVAGAMIGAVSAGDSCVRLVLSDVECPMILINTTPFGKDRFSKAERSKTGFQWAQSLYSIFITIINESKVKALQSTVDSENIPEQIRLLAKLRDDGILSENEFQQKKADLLKRM